MSVVTDDLLSDAERLPCVPFAAVAEYRLHLPEMVQYVDDAVSSAGPLDLLIGGNPVTRMQNNHVQHGTFMSTIFALSDYDCLCKMAPWLYRLLHSNGFSWDYFLVQLQGWQGAVDTYLSEISRKSIGVVYAWFIEHHEDFVQLAQSDLNYEMPLKPEWLAMRSTFEKLLVAGEREQCNALAQEHVKVPSDVEPFYAQVIRPVLYEIGMLWEQGKISVAQEHLASAIVGQIMATVSMTVIQSSKHKGRLVVTSSPNEFHEIGAWMIADILANDGWDVRYLGANVPETELMESLSTFRPDVLAISVTMPFNVEKARAIIGSLRAHFLLKYTKIMVGGRGLAGYEDRWADLGADGFALSIDGAKKVANQWDRSHYA